MTSTQIFSVLLTAILTENFVLSKFLGICPFLGVSKKVNTAMGMSVAVIFVMLISTAVTFPINTFLQNNDLGYLQTIVCILVIAALVQLVEIVLKKYIKSLYNALGIYLPLITTNCAVLGVVKNNISDGYGFLESSASALGCGLGFLLAMVLFAGVRERIETSNPPKSFQGVPITLVSAAIVSLSFYGFAGVIDSLFA